jgi:hypothetical protein
MLRIGAVLALALPGAGFLVLQGLGPSVASIAGSSFVRMWDNWLIESSVAAEISFVTTPLAIALAFFFRRSLSGFSQAVVWILCGLAVLGTVWFWGMMFLFGF